MNLLQEFPNITCKKTDHVGIQQKEEAWRLITAAYNQNAVLYRTTKQLQYKFNNMKKTARKELSSEKKSRRQTGGGPPSPKPSAPTEWLNNIMGESISGMAAVYDMDVVNESIIEDDEKIDSKCVSVNKENVSTTNKNSGDTENIQILEFSFETNMSKSNNHLLSEPAPSCSITKTHDLEPIMCSNYSEVTAELDKKKSLAFDASTPKAMLRRLPSKELFMESNKKKIKFTPLQTRKTLINHINKKADLIETKLTRESSLFKFAEEEHIQNMRHKEELHLAQLKHQEELHCTELKYKESLYYAKLKEINETIKYTELKKELHQKLLEIELKIVEKRLEDINNK